MLLQVLLKHPEHVRAGGSRNAPGALVLASEVSGCDVCHWLDGGNSCLEATSYGKHEKCMGVRQDDDNSTWLEVMHRNTDICYLSQMRESTLQYNQKNQQEIAVS